MEDFKAGDLVFLTRAFDTYVRVKNPLIRPVLTNRLAKIEEIIDWGSDKGKAIKAARIKSGKWAGLPMDDCQYLLSVFYHELPGRNGGVGVAERGKVMFSKNPKTGEPFFEKVPDWIYREIVKKCESFTVELKSGLSG